MDTQIKNPWRIATKSIIDYFNVIHNDRTVLLQSTQPLYEGLEYIFISKKGAFSKNGIPGGEDRFIEIISFLVNEIMISDVEFNKNFNKRNDLERLTYGQYRKENDANRMQHLNQDDIKIVVKELLTDPKTDIITVLKKFEVPIFDISKILKLVSIPKGININDTINDKDKCDKIYSEITSLLQEGPYKFECKFNKNKDRDRELYTEFTKQTNQYLIDKNKEIILHIISPSSLQKLITAVAQGFKGSTILK